jgi:hypothetical protein
LLCPLAQQSAHRVRRPEAGRCVDREPPDHGYLTSSIVV